MRIKSVLLLGALAAAILIFTPERPSANNVDSIIEFYNDINTRYYANEKNLSEAIGYTNVKISDKYRIERILSKVEEDPSSAFSRFAEFKFRDSVSYGNTLDDKGFIALIKELYGALPSYGASRSVFFSSGDDYAVKSAETLICKGVGKDFSVSADGVRWYYSGNYVFSSERGKLGAVIRSPRGMTKGSSVDGFGYFTSKRFVSPQDVSSSGSMSVGALCEETLRLPSGAAFYVTCDGYSSPLLIYFSDRTKKADD